MTQQTAQSLGQLLLQARLDSGKTLQELYEETLVSVKYLTALEQNAFDELPSAAYIKGYVRRIAEALGTPAEPLIAAYDHRSAAMAVVTPVAINSAAVSADANANVDVDADADAQPCHASSGRNYFVDLVRLTQHLVGYLWSDIFPWLRDRLPAKRLLTILGLLIVIVFAYRSCTTPSVVIDESASVPSESIIAPATETAAEPSAEAITTNTITDVPEAAPAAVVPAPVPAPVTAPLAVPGPDSIEIDFYGPSVVRIVDANGKPIASGLKRAGESIRARGTQPFKIQVGNPSVTDIRVNGIVVQGTPL